MEQATPLQIVENIIFEDLDISDFTDEELKFLNCSDVDSDYYLDGVENAFKRIVD